MVVGLYLSNPRNAYNLNQVRKQGTGVFVTPIGQRSDYRFLCSHEVPFERFAGCVRQQKESSSAVVGRLGWYPASQDFVLVDDSSFAL